jgi:hypothetical protein
MTRLLGNRRSRRASTGERRLIGISEHTLLVVGGLLFALLAVASVLVAITT